MNNYNPATDLEQIDHNKSIVELLKSISQNYDNSDIVETVSSVYIQNLTEDYRQELCGNSEDVEVDPEWFKAGERSSDNWWP